VFTVYEGPLLTHLVYWEGP